MKKLSITFIFAIMIYTLAYAEDFTGSYTASAEGTTIISLTMNQDASGNITGTIQSGTDTAFQIEGIIEEGNAVGALSSSTEAAYFQAQFEGEKLLFTIIDPDMFGMPDYNTARQLTMTREGAAKKPKQEDTAVTSIPDQTPKKTSPKQAAPVPVTVSGEAVTDSNWGFSFSPPEGWKYKKNTDGVVLGHDTIAGMVVVIAHRDSGGEASVRAQLKKGHQDETTRLDLKSALERVGDNALGGDYEGSLDGRQAKARVVGTYSPYGGGAYIIAVSTKDKFGPQISEVADAIAKSMSYKKVDASALMQHFAGKWTQYSKYTQTDMYLAANGQYYENYESSYGGGLSNQYGDTTATWLAGGQQNSSGRWTVRGNKQKGSITILYNNGNEYVMEYNVHVENGNVYWNEYYFDGKLYGKSGE